MLQALQSFLKNITKWSHRAAAVTQEEEDGRPLTRRSAVRSPFLPHSPHADVSLLKTLNPKYMNVSLKTGKVYEYSPFTIYMPLVFDILVYLLCV